MTAAVVRAVRSGERRRGAALPIVLLFAALLAGLAAAAMRSSLSAARAAAAFAEEIQADELGRGAGDALSYHLATHDKTVRRGGRLALHLPGAEIDLAYRSESARVDVNLAPPALIEALLVAAGDEPAAAAEAADRVRRFRKETLGETSAGAAAPIPDPGGSPGSSALREPSGTAERPGGSRPTSPGIHDTAEVVRAWGLSEDVARRVLPSLTVSNGTPQVDPVLADRLVLMALLGSAERVDDYLARREQGFVNEDSALELLPVPSRAFAGFHDSEAVRAVAKVSIARGLTRRYEMVVAPVRSSARSAAEITASSVPVVISWRRLT